MEPVTKLPEADREALRRALRANPLAKVARALGVGREAVARLSAGVEVRAGTVALARARWAELVALTPPPTP